MPANENSTSLHFQTNQNELTHKQPNNNTHAVPCPYTPHPPHTPLCNAMQSEPFASDELRRRHKQVQVLVQHTNDAIATPTGHIPCILPAHKSPYAPNIPIHPQWQHRVTFSRFSGPQIKNNALCPRRRFIVTPSLQRICKDTEWRDSKPIHTGLTIHRHARRACAGD